MTVSPTARCDECAVNWNSLKACRGLAQQCKGCSGFRHPHSISEVP